MIVPGIPFVPAKYNYDDRDDRKFAVAIHNTSNTASARSEARYAQNRTDGVSCHFFVDNIEVIQVLDTVYSKAGHAGSNEGNENAIAIEIVGQNGNPRDWWLANVRWDLLAAVLAQVIRAELPGFQVRRASVAEMQANPKVPAFYAHDDMRLAWGHTDHDDPGPNFPWDHLFATVNAALTGSPITNMQEDGMHLVSTPGGSIWYFPGTVDAVGKPYMCGPPLAVVTALSMGMQTIRAAGELDQSYFHRFAWGDPIPTPAPPSGGGGTCKVDVESLVAAFADPRVQATLVDTSFQGAQQAETR